MDELQNFIISPERLPDIRVKTLPGVEIKIFNIDEKLGIWSVLVRIEPGSFLPAHQNSDMCEMYVIKGKGCYTQDGVFMAGGYIRENAGAYAQMGAEEEVMLFMTHHGACTFLNQDGTNMLTADILFFKEQISDRNLL